jgi:hypothetical protein
MLEKFVCENKDSEFTKYDFFYKMISKIEDQLIQSIHEKGPARRFRITDIKPTSDTTVNGKCAILGRGKLPISDNCCNRTGKGVKITLMTPVMRGSELNFALGQTIMYIKDNRIDMSCNMSPGAFWYGISRVIKDGNIDEYWGVAFAPGIRIGEMYFGDGEMMIDFIKSKDKTVICPAGTSGSIHRLIGEITIGEYVFIGEYDPINPLTFLLHKDYGYVYLRGRGTVILPDGTKKEFE